MTLKRIPGMARFDFMLDVSRISKEQSKGLKHLTGGGTIAFRGHLSPKHANALMRTLIKIRKEASEAPIAKPAGYDEAEE